MIRRLDVKIVLAVLATVVVPLGFSVYLAASAIETSLGLGLNDDLERQIENGIEGQRMYIEEIKRCARVRFSHLMDSKRLNEAADLGEDAVRSTIERFLEEDSGLRLVRLTDRDGRSIEVKSAREPRSQSTRSATMKQELEIGPYVSVEAVFALDDKILSDYKKAGQDFATYRALVDAPPSYLNNRFVWVYLAVLGVTVILSVSLGVIWARLLAKRIHRLSKATDLVAGGDLTVRVDPGSRDEVGRLVESFNSMVTELSVSRARIEYLQKISAWQEMARRLAHEIKNPLTPIQLAAQQLKEKYQGDDPKFRRLLEQSTEIIEEEVGALRRMTSDFSTFSKLPEVRPESVDLKEFLGDLRSSLSSFAEQEGVDLCFEMPDRTTRLMLDKMMMRRVFDNLVRNSIEALKHGRTEHPKVSVSAKRRTAGKGAEMEIRIEDNGPGVKQEDQLKIFDPYFTTKIEGTGLGLAISKKIVLDHGGRIWVEQIPEGGAGFVVALPLPGKKK